MAFEMISVYLANRIATEFVNKHNKLKFVYIEYNIVPFALNSIKNLSFTIYLGSQNSALCVLTFFRFCEIISAVTVLKGCLLILEK